jgi:hypothetical protein
MSADGECVCRIVDLRAVVTQLAAVVRKLDALIPDHDAGIPFDADRPRHMQLSYITRARSFTEAAGRGRTKKQKGGA